MPSWVRGRKLWLNFWWRYCQKTPRGGASYGSENCHFLCCVMGCGVGLFFGAKISVGIFSHHILLGGSTIQLGGTTIARWSNHMWGEQPYALKGATILWRETWLARVRNHIVRRRNHIIRRRNHIAGWRNHS